MPQAQRLQTRARCSADPATVWSLLSEPVNWPRWAPHIAAVDTDRLGSVEPGQRVRIHPLMTPDSRIGRRFPSVVADITFVDPGRRWDFDVALPIAVTVHSRHDLRRVSLPKEGCEIVVTMHADSPLPGVAAGIWPALVAYQPLARVALRRLARLAEAAYRSAENA